MENWSIHQPINQSISQPTNQLVWVGQSVSQSKGRNFNKEVSKVYSLCILDFMIYNQLNEVYNLQQHIVQYYAKYEPYNNNYVNIKLEMYISRGLTVMNLREVLLNTKNYS